MSVTTPVIHYWRTQWAHLPEDTVEAYGTLAVKVAQGSGFIERAFGVSVTRHELDAWVADQPSGDLYFSARIFEKPARSNATAFGSRFLYADLDEAEVDPVRWPPIWWWMTSPGMTQAVWLAEDWMQPEEHGRINRWLTYALGADRGGWHASKLLRVPDTMNWKRAKRSKHSVTVPIGETITHPETTSWRGPIIPMTRFEGALTGPADKAIANASLDPPPVTIPREEWAGWVERKWGELPLSVRAALEQGHVSDRSEFLWRFYQACRANGIGKETCFHLVLWMPWNKWPTTTELWRDINRGWGR